ncbi:hypothetical protein GEMRC1_008964 [Eukaryota sp. GEM-RC1]
MIISNVTCDQCFNVHRGNISATLIDIFDVSGILFQLEDVDISFVNFLNIFLSDIDFGILAENSTLKCADLFIYQSFVDQLVHLNQSCGDFERFLIDNSSLDSVFLLNEAQVTLSEFMFSNISITRGYSAHNSILSFNDFVLEDLSIYDSFISIVISLLILFRPNLPCVTVSLDSLI